MIFMLIVFLIMLIPPMIAALVIGLITRGLRPEIRTPLLILASLLLLTPSLGPATIAVVPAPFVYLVIPTVLEGSWSELGSWLMSYPLWHAIAFPATAIVSYMTVHWLRPNNSFKPKPLRGSA